MNMPSKSVSRNLIERQKLNPTQQQNRSEVWPLLVMLSVAIAPAAQAQTAAASGSTEPAAIEEVVVTGSRIVRDGYETPTALTIISEDEIQATAPTNVADFVNQIPSVVGSSTPANSNTSASSGRAGLNVLNLRSFGASRTLVLLDGKRSAGSALDGAVDINTFPQGLVKGVEIVTGGASAAYGSDAVSGVVNFILDDDLTGVRGSIVAGETTYGDDRRWKFNLAGGKEFAGGRGHAVFDVEITDREGIYGVPREWNNDGWYIMNNPAYVAGNGEPERLLMNNIGLSNAAPGGIITNTDLRGIYFGQNGTVNQFAYGETRDPWMIGGDWEMVQVNDRQSLHADEERRGFFGKVRYELTDNVEAFAQASWNQHASLGYIGIQFNQANIPIESDNAFIPESVRTQLNDLGITQFRLGSSNAGLPVRKSDNQRESTRLLVGLEGNFEAFGRPVTWDAYMQHGETNTDEMLRDITNNARLAAAQDAVFHPVTNEIVCRSSIADPGNGCIPLNRLGLGVADPAAVAAVIGNPLRNQTFTQKVAAANFRFDVFDTWTAPVSVATGIEYREEEASGSVAEEFQSGWFVGNFKPTFGKYDVTEAYVETVVPVLEGLDVNGAVRATDYSTSGNVTTWKLGVTYSPIDDLRFRATRSRDIRAPNLQELFEGGGSRTNTLIDPFNANTSIQFTEIRTGNIALTPEEADTWGIGAVFQPTFLPGFGLSVDYYEITLEGAIGSVDAQTIVNRCFEGLQQYCAAISRDNSTGVNLISQISVSPFNFAVREARGIDYEASYRISLADFAGGLDGDLTLRALATNYLENYENNGIDTPTDSAGQNNEGGPPEWLYRLVATYQDGPVTLNLIGRGISDGVYDNSFVECTSGCPESTIDNRTINSNHIDGAFYIDFSMAYAFEMAGSESEAFLSITNLGNRDPAIVANGPGGSAYGNISTNQTLYDILGRNFNLGLRFRF